MKFYSKPVAEDAEAPLADEGRLEAIVEHWTRRESPKSSPDQNACYVVSIGLEGELSEGQHQEILALVGARGDRVVGHHMKTVERFDPRTLFGRGSCETLAARAQEAGADMLVVDAELTPSQLRNLEDATGMAVCDREAVILNVFLRHAKTRLAQTQVEIAELEYLRPRIRGLGLDLDQQTGGVMKGGRGPGETASELRARQLDGRLAELKRKLEKLEIASEMQRKGRHACPRIALVGYTNAGKTSLMNALTGSALSARDMPFETLDTTSRCLTRHGGEVLLSDTVGFIRRLPERLFASFASTLAEIREASLLAIVVDVSDPEFAMHLATTESTLEVLGADQVPRFYVFNKVDRVIGVMPHGVLARLAGDHPFRLLSAHDAAAVDELRADLIASVRPPVRRVFVPYAAARAMSLVYGKCRVLEATPAERGLLVEIEGPEHVLAEIEAEVLV